MSRYSGQHEYADQQSAHPSRGQADFYGDVNQYLAMGSPGDVPMAFDQNMNSDPATHGMGSGSSAGPFSNLEVFAKQAASPGISLENNLNYKHVRGMNATNFNQHSSANNLPRESGGMQSVIASSGATGSQYAKPKMRIQNSMASQYGQNTKRSSNASQAKNYPPGNERGQHQSSRYSERRGNTGPRAS
jgi:hypothetical protein